MQAYTTACTEDPLALASSFARTSRYQRMLRAIAVIASATALTVAAACSGSTSERESEVQRDRVVELTHELVPLEPQLPNIEVSGSYVQVSGMPDLRVVNALLQDLVFADQRKIRGSFPEGTTGAYYAFPDKGWISANSVFVSVLFPAGFEPDEGSAADYWLSLTVLIPQVVEVVPTDLVVDPIHAASVLAALSKDQLRTSGSECMQLAVDDPLSPGDWNASETYRKFAMIPDGLVIGFDQYEIAPAACGAASVMIPWAELEPLLNDRGIGLVDMLRREG